MHPNNRYGNPHNFPELANVVPALKDHFVKTPDGRTSLDFAHPDAVRLLNKALLLKDYNLKYWDIPAGNLCPGVPGRLDYIHVIADLLAEDVVADRGRSTGAKKQTKEQGKPKGPAPIGLDIGTGASLIYPILGVKEYGYRFVATDVEDASLKVAGAIAKINPALTKSILLRKQEKRTAIFHNVIFPNETFAFTMCNPPFFDSPEEAENAARTKWAKLGRADSPTVLNFGGKGSELWTKGGEAAFLRHMINESVDYAEQVGWFTTLVSKKGYLNIADIEFGRLRITDYKVINIGQGGKKRRILAWRF
jgi:23S rRNA (adenine1618-N6)-methyltransferase